MTDNVIAYFYRERLVVTVASIVIVAGGIFALYNLNVDAFPDVTPVQVEIDTEAEGLAPLSLKLSLNFRPVCKPKIHILMPGCPELARWPPRSAPLC